LLDRGRIEDIFQQARDCLRRDPRTMIDASAK
jgi:hypothetical protein